MNSAPSKWLAALVAPAVMVAVASIIGIYTSGNDAPGRQPESLTCRALDGYPDTQPREADSGAQEFGPDPTHEKELNALPRYPGCVHGAEPATNGFGTFVSFWVGSSPEEVASFYRERLPALGWQAASDPTRLPTKDAALLPQTLVTFVKGKYLLSIYLDPNGAKGGERGSLNVTFRLQEPESSTT